jgi:hypothetical protein
MKFRYAQPVNVSHRVLYLHWFQLACS